MSLRSVELFFPSDQIDLLKTILDKFPAIPSYSMRISDDTSLVKILADSDSLEPLLDALQNQFCPTEHIRILILPVEATIPRMDKEEELLPPSAPEVKTPSGMINREELYHDIEETVRLNWIFVLMVILSAIVASVGLLRNNTAVIIGAMVIAPLLGPNMALSLAFTLADFNLARRAIHVNTIGVLLGFCFAVLVGVLFTIDPSLPEISARTEVGPSDIILALASGIAATLSVTTGISSVLVGVMVAIALLPPLVTFGMLAGAGYWNHAFHAFLLLLTNLICLNLASISTFVLLGIRPRTWWQAEQARKATKTAIFIWSLLLLILIYLILFSIEM